MPLKKSELKKGRRGGRGRRQEEGFSLFFREEYPPRDARILYEKKWREKGKETQGGGRTLPMNRFTSVSLRAHASTTRRRRRLLFVFPLSLSLLKFEREREIEKKEKKDEGKR